MVKRYKRNRGYRQIIPHILYLVIKQAKTPIKVT